MSIAFLAELFFFSLDQNPAWPVNRGFKSEVKGNETVTGRAGLPVNRKITARSLFPSKSSGSSFWSSWLL
jgi:hypothetical protein